MDPSFKFPLRGKSFFIKELGSQLIGAGIELRRGLFQSLRPGIERGFLNVDVTTAMMYRTGNLLELCIDVAEVPYNSGATFFTPGHANYRDDRRRLVESFITGVKVLVPTTGNRARPVRALTSQGANTINFDLDGKKTTVAAYFQKLGHQVSTPQVICAQVRGISCGTFHSSQRRTT
jgi:eukaryotic translation initiation factor 2C